jgi:hypothetical protein
MPIRFECIGADRSRSIFHSLLILFARIATLTTAATGRARILWFTPAGMMTALIYICSCPWGVGQKRVDKFVRYILRGTDLSPGVIDSTNFA